MKRNKYPRTFHLPWSESKTDDDKTLDKNQVNKNFEGKIVVVTEKLDGENTTIYSDGYCHARSIDSKDHESRSYVKALAARIGNNLPEGWRIVGENIFAKHSIEYTDLPSYFLLFGIIDNYDNSISWKEVEEYSNILELKTVPVIYIGVYDEKKIKESKPNKSAFGNDIEGYVVRNYESFPMNSFSENVAKFVRKNHIQSDNHWMYQKITANKLKNT